MPRSLCWGAALLLAACAGESPRELPVTGPSPSASGGSPTVPGHPAAAGSAGTAPVAGVSGGGAAALPAAGQGGSDEASGGAQRTEQGGAGGESQAELCAPWPEPSGSVELDEPLTVDGAFDGELKRHAGANGSGGQDEGQDPLFILEDGAILENVVLGAPAGDGIHCLGSCTLRNVWWEDVGEDAATLKGESESQVMLVECGGARLAEDKVFQHNGPGTLIIRHFEADGFGKLYRSCGNCSSMYERHVELEHIVARSGDALVGINANYGDTARLSHVLVHGSAEDTDVCQRYEGNDTGDEPVLIGTGADTEHCLFEGADVTFVE